MNAKTTSGSQTSLESVATTELLILPDGEVLVHNLTPEFAAILAQLDPEDPLMKVRACKVSLPPGGLTA